MSIIINVGDYKIRVTKNDRNNCLVGEFLSTNKFQKIYADSLKEIEEIAEELVKASNNNESGS